MLPIHKKNIDPLQDFRRIPSVQYSDNRLPKNALKLSLLLEQGYLCAYCMSRITDITMNVEHWMPQNPISLAGNLAKEEEEEKNRLLGIDYKNMLAVCKGNEGNPESTLHCDKRKHNNTLTYNPADRNHHLLLKIRYLKSTGKIESEHYTFCKELGDIEKGTEGVLNLNCTKLMNNRLDVINAVFKKLSKLPTNTSPKKILSLLRQWQKLNAKGMFEEYSGVAIYFLEKRLGIHTKRG